MIKFGLQNTVSKLFLKNLFSFSRYRPSKSGTSAGSILCFIRFQKINNRKTFFCDVTSDQSSLSVQSAVTYVTAKEVETAKFDNFLEEIVVHCAAYDCLMVVGRPKAFPSTNFKQVTKEGGKP